MSRDELSSRFTPAFREGSIDVQRLHAMWSSMLIRFSYGLRLWASVSLALFVAYQLELDNAYWAAATASVVCQPGLGASLRKGRYRCIGTIVGAVTIVALTAAFPQSRVGFLAGLALWCAICAFLATILRSSVSYAAGLAGFTAVIIFSGVVDNPGDTFRIAVTRSSEICIGILSAELVLMVTDVGGARRQLLQALAEVAHQIAIGFWNTLVQGMDTSESRQKRRELTLHVSVLNNLIDEAIGEESDLRSRSSGLEAALEGLLRAISAWRGIGNHLGTLPAIEGNAAASSLLSATIMATASDWLRDPLAVREICRADGREILAMPAADVTARILVDGTAEALEGLERAANGLVLVTSPGCEHPDRSGAWSTVPDMLPAVINAFRTFITLIAVEIIWIDTNWSDGQSVIVFAAIIVIMFSPLAEQAYPTAARFALGAALTAVLAAIVHFAVLPAVHDFFWLILVLAVVLVPFGALSAGQWQKLVFTAAVVLFMPLLAIENQPTYDVETFFNSALAIVTGVALAMVFLSIVPPLGPAWRARRLLALSLRDLRRLAVRPKIPESDAWISLLNRRLEAIQPEAALEQSAQLVAAFSVGQAVIHLRTMRPRVARQQELDRALSALAAGDVGRARRAFVHFANGQNEGAAPEALVGMRARAAATAIIDALARRPEFFTSTQQLLWGGPSILRAGIIVP